MSILAENENGWIISHVNYFEGIQIWNTDETVKTVRLTPDIFDITNPFAKTRLKNSVTLSHVSVRVKSLSKSLVELGHKLNILEDEKVPVVNEIETVQEIDRTVPVKKEAENFISNKQQLQVTVKTNEKARRAASDFFEEIADLKFTENTLHGMNSSDYGRMFEFCNQSFVIPKDTKFYSNDVKNLGKELSGDKFNLIVMDPPWWNKYIRRRKRKQSEAGYELLENFQIGELPIAELCEANALVCVWCTNSTTHQNQVIREFFPKWGIELVTVWHWLKVTKSGVPVCPFNAENKKQPYEAIIIGRRPETNVLGQNPSLNSDFTTSRVVLSVPSSINSHKPPLLEIISSFFELDNAGSIPLKGLEIFARYLVPHFTCFGNEVLKLQHNSLYVPQQG